jgi:hypothetical protein
MMKTKKIQYLTEVPIALFHQGTLDKQNYIMEVVIPDFNYSQNALLFQRTDTHTLPPARTRIDDVKYLKYYIQLINTGRFNPES